VLRTKVKNRPQVLGKSKVVREQHGCHAEPSFVTPDDDPGSMTAECMDCGSGPQ
jgi:hypothetical protein